MTPEEAHRHEWFAAASPVRSIAVASSSSSQQQQQSAAAESIGSASSGPVKTEPCSDSDGLFYNSSTVSSVGDKSSMYQVHRAKRNTSAVTEASSSAETATQSDENRHVNEPSHPVARKRIDGNSNLDDSGTFFPSIL